MGDDELRAGWHVVLRGGPHHGRVVRLLDGPAPARTPPAGYEDGRDDYIDTGAWETVEGVRCRVLRWAREDEVARRLLETVDL